MVAYQDGPCRRIFISSQKGIELLNILILNHQVLSRKLDLPIQELNRKDRFKNCVGLLSGQ